MTPLGPRIPSPDRIVIQEAAEEGPDSKLVVGDLGTQPVTEVNQEARFHAECCNEGSMFLD